MAQILVIDDEDGIREMMAAALHFAGHDVTAARSGREATKILGTRPADLVITDLIMPDQDGIETITWVHKIHPGLPVIAISGSSVHSALYLKMAAQLGARRILKKPFSAGELISLTNEVLAASTSAAKAGD